jgi:hypothetical protein
MREGRVARLIKNALLVLVGMLLTFGLRATGALDPLVEAAQGVAPAASAPRRGSDPLSDGEKQQAYDLARRAPIVIAALQAATRTEVLLVERHDEAKATTQGSSWPRRASVYIYAYGSDLLIHAVIDLGKRNLSSIETLRGVQLPPTAAEAARAVKIALADPQVGPAIRARYQELTGSPLTGPDQLQGRAAVFRADSQPAAAHGTAASCGARRCAQLVLATPSGALLPMLPIVDLSSEQVVTLGR